ncbi:hypothetical protein CVT24_008472 [Panaeolus cyanescens]|uniref:E3 ubiquitin-protein ligase listerin n=1 Tax=Panaeolus cyanescens TaxID=181874 RepID=A0A409VBT5_9AGAR|nr:hypothetical protein CVT24_008472 [Panaeolus cyanescens]
MVKGNPKSSATSATRKKHAKKHAGPEDQAPQKEKKKQRGEKGKKKEPRVKMYIPPVKPAPALPDPLETTGLSRSLPADLLVVLRNISKKAQVTKIRALEEFQSKWVEPCLKGSDDTGLVYIVVEMLPVWLHHVSSLFVHPSRRVRALAATIHAALLQIPETLDQIVFFFRESASASQLESILGTWCLAANDIDRAVALVASRSWKAFIVSTLPPTTTNAKQLVLDDNSRSSLLSFLQRTILDPNGVYIYLNPPPPTAPPPPSHPSKKSFGKNSSATPQRDDGDATPRSKIDEQEESEVDRRGRLRIADVTKNAADALPSFSDDLQDFLSNPALWTSISPLETSPWLAIESFGYQQPNVRKATWSLVNTILAKHKDNIGQFLPLLSRAILRSAWIETDVLVQGSMWQPLLVFLKQFPESWRLVSAPDVKADGDSESDESEQEEVAAPPASSKDNAQSDAYDEFLRFLELGCSGSPQQGYPAVVLIVSTIPSSILASHSAGSNPLSHFFTSFWKAIDGRALSSLHRSVASAAFLSSLLECMIFLVKRLRNDALRDGSDTTALASASHTSQDTALLLIKEQFSRILSEVSSGALKIEERALSRLLGQTLESLAGIDEILFDCAWNSLVESLSSSDKASESRLAPIILKVFYDRFQEGTILKKRTEKLLQSFLVDSSSRATAILEQLPLDAVPTDLSSFVFLLGILDQFREGAFVDAAFAQSLDDLIGQHSFTVLKLAPDVLLSYIRYRKDEKAILGSWHNLLVGIAQWSGEGSPASEKAVGYLLDAAGQGKLPSSLRPTEGELDSLVGTLLEQSLEASPGSDKGGLMSQILRSHQYFVSPSGLNTFLQIIIATFSDKVHAFIEGKDISIAAFEGPLGCLKVVFSSIISDNDLVASLVPGLFVFTYLVPRHVSETAAGSTIIADAQNLWEEFLKSSPEKQTQLPAVIAELAKLVYDATTIISPQDILAVTSQVSTGIQINAITELLPSPQNFDSLLNDISTDSVDPSLAVSEPWLASLGLRTAKNASPPTTDHFGFSSYARLSNALLQILSESPHLAPQNLWAVRHLLALQLFASDLLAVPSSASANPAFAASAISVNLEGLVSKVKQVVPSIILAAIEGESQTWRRTVVDKLMEVESGKKEEAVKQGLTGAQAFLFGLIRQARVSETLQDSRILRIVLNQVLGKSFNDISEAESWMLFARKIEKSAQRTSIVVVATLTNTAVESPRLDRYRNELAASLLGIKPKDASTEGLLALRRLAATIPPADSEVIFLPSNRAVNVIKACQTWVLAEDGDGDDDNVDEKTENAMLPVFEALAPILQNISGSHWGFIFDVLEGVLDRVAEDLKDGELDEETESQNLVALSGVLRLVIVMEELTKRNQTLMDEWTTHRNNVLAIIRDMTTSNSTSKSASAPRSACLELMLEIIQNLPKSLIDENTLGQMVHLVEDRSTSVQQKAYQLLHSAARKRTEHFVIEAGVALDANEDGTSSSRPRLPDELLEIVGREVSLHEQAEVEDDLKQYRESENAVFGSLLAWMLVFDSFQDASFKVKSSYIEQLRDEDLINGRFIPLIIGLLKLDQGLAKAFKLDIWGVDEFYVQYYRPGGPHAIHVLGAHIFYRSLLTTPSLIYAWVLDCKDRQLSNTITTYTSTHLSPVLIRSELDHVRANLTAKDGGESLTNENMVVKVTGPGVVNEVSAAYNVDEHSLEIRLRIPNDWPLHRIEVKDMKRVGVDENRWRAWLLGVQQVIWANNGRIVDGLGLFKKNVSLHFEGQVECAICYSVISVTDGSLPKKPCKTCKNRFHAACLYKWFNTSHSSSCPLCRSDII